MSFPSTEQQIELRNLRHEVYRISDALTDRDCKIVYNEIVRASNGEQPASPVINATIAFLADRAEQAAEEAYNSTEWFTA